MDAIKVTDENEKEVIDGGFIAQLASGDRMSVQHYRIEPGAGVPEHHHHHEQVGFVYQGTLTFIVDGEEQEVGPGESFALLSEEPHGVENRGDEAVLGIDVFSPPREKTPWE